MRGSGLRKYLFAGDGKSEMYRRQPPILKEKMGWQHASPECSVYRRV
jgi:hypothetical protein